MAVLTANAHLFYREFQHRDQNQMNGGCSVSILGAGFCSSNGGEMGKGRRRAVKKGTRWRAFWQEVSRPISVEMEPITGAEHLDQILQEAQQLSQPIVIDWMAAWCRKCIYLKPKLEKLAGEFHTEAKFYFVDVNKVSQALVKRGNISKMPTIQVWKDGEMKEEVIGGHKAWLVVDEVREMVRKYI